MRSDRLFELIQILRDGKLHRASDLAARVKVSTRTIWRDMATLQASGLPVEGEWVWRAYSICSSVFDEHLEFLVCNEKKS